MVAAAGPKNAKLVNRTTCQRDALRRGNIVMPLQSDAYNPEIIRCPWAFDAQLRAEAPVYHDEKNGIFLVSSYALVEEVIKDPETFSSRYMEKMIAKEPFPPEVLAIYAEGFPVVDALLVTDGAQHDRHRRMVAKAFSRKRLDELAPLFDARIADLFARVRANGRMRFREDVADAVPLIMTQHQLRIPDTEMPQVVEWSKILSSGFGGVVKPIDDMKYEARRMLDFQRYFAARIEHESDRFLSHGERERDDDLLTLLADAVRDPADPMDMIEALSFLFNLLPATHDTTTASLTACMHRLAANPSAQARAVSDPEFLKKFVDEAMRHESPIRAFWRRAVVDVTLGDVFIPAGSWLLLRISSANRDDAVFGDAASFDPDRRMVKPHLSFGTGIHTCAGRMFARHIIVAVLQHLVSSAKGFHFVEGANAFDHEVNLLAAPFTELEIAFEPVDGVVLPAH